MRKWYNAWLLIGLLVAFTGCSKEEDAAEEEEQDPCEMNDRTGMLTRKAWKVSSIKIVPPIDTVIGGFDIKLEDVTFLILSQECELDDLKIFYADGTGSEDEGSMKCDPNSPQSSPFTWTWGTDQTEMTILAKNDTIQFTDIDMDCQVLRGVSTEKYAGFERYSPVVTFIAVD